MALRLPRGGISLRSVTVFSFELLPTTIVGKPLGMSLSSLGVVLNGRRLALQGGGHEHLLSTGAARAGNIRAGDMCPVLGDRSSMTKPKREAPNGTPNKKLDVSIIPVISCGHMKTEEVVSALGALAHEFRIAIYRLLVEQGPAGLPAGIIGERVGLVPSSLTFHLQALQRAGLITQVRASRQLIYSADFTAMNDLVGYLTDKCCTASGDSCVTACKPARVVKPTRRRNAA